MTKKLDIRWKGGHEGPLGSGCKEKNCIGVNPRMFLFEENQRG